MKSRGLFVMLAFVVAAATVVFSNVNPGRVPEVLQGRWVSEDPRYESCFIYLSEDSVQIGDGEGGSDSGVVYDIHLDRDQGFQRYEIAYFDSVGETMVLSLNYDPSDGGALHLGSQDDIRWWRESDYDL